MRPRRFASCINAGNLRPQNPQTDSSIHLPTILTRLQAAHPACRSLLMSKKRLAFWLCLCLLAPMAGDARISRDPLGSLVSYQSAPLVINEYLADPPAGPAGDANGDGVTSTSQDEFVELINAGNAPLGVGGFSISDAVQTRFTFPPGVVIPAGEAAVIFGGGSPRGDFGNARANGLVFTSALSLNNGSDSIIIKDNLGVEVTRHEYPPPESDTNQLITRSPDINGSFVEHSAAPGSDGRLFSPGTLITGSAFTVAPNIARISPDRVPFRSPGFDLSVEGSGFESESKVFIDSSPVATSFINAGGLTATVPEGVTNVFGPHFVEVRNQGGNRSNTVTLTVTPPPPVLLSVLPRLVNVGTGNFTLFALGENFDAGSVVIVEETVLSTTRISSVELRATVPAAITATLGQRRVRARNSDGQQSRELGVRGRASGLAGYIDYTFAGRRGRSPGRSRRCGDKLQRRGSGDTRPDASAYASGFGDGDSGRCCRAAVGNAGTQGSARAKLRRHNLERSSVPDCAARPAYPLHRSVNGDRRQRRSKDYNHRRAISAGRRRSNRRAVSASTKARYYLHQ